LRKGRIIGGSDLKWAVLHVVENKYVALAERLECELHITKARGWSLANCS